MTVVAVIRVRGSVGVKGEIEETLRRLRLTRVNHAGVFYLTPPVEGMIKKAKDYVTWGEIGKDLLKELLLKRGELIGGKKVTEESVKEACNKTLDDIIEEIFQGKLRFSDCFKPLRLHPPRKGYRSIKLPFKLGGALGYRAKEIENLLRRMM